MENAPTIAPCLQPVAIPCLKPVAVVASSSEPDKPDKLSALEAWLVFWFFLIWGTTSAVMWWDNYANRYPEVGLQEDNALKYPRNWRVNLNVSKEMIDHQDWPRALSYAYRAVTLHPERSAGWINMSTAAARIGAWQIARHALEQAFLLRPQRAIAKNLVVAFRMCGQNDAADRLESTLGSVPEHFNQHEPYLCGPTCKHDR